LGWNRKWREEQARIAGNRPRPDDYSSFVATRIIIKRALGGAMLFLVAVALWTPLGYPLLSIFVGGIAVTVIGMVFGALWRNKGLRPPAAKDR
jgi:hypothetical protein